MSEITEGGMIEVRSELDLKGQRGDTLSEVQGDTTRRKTNMGKRTET